MNKILAIGMIVMRLFIKLNSEGGFFKITVVKNNH